MTPSNAMGVPTKKQVMKKYGLSAFEASLIWNPKKPIKPKYRLKGESVKDARARINKSIDNKLKQIFV